jgi:predicted XRE-type DNA-binding protein
VTQEVPEHEIGSGNVFAGIGRPDAETHTLKARLISRMRDILDERGLSQAAAATLMGVRQPDLSNLLRGRFRGFSVERLMGMLAGLGCEVAITLRPEGVVAPTDTIRLRRPEPASREFVDSVPG